MCSKLLFYLLLQRFATFYSYSKKHVFFFNVEFNLIKSLCKTLLNRLKNFGLWRQLLLIFGGVVAIYVPCLVPVLWGPLGTKTSRWSFFYKAEWPYMYRLRSTYIFVYTSVYIVLCNLPYCGVVPACKIVPCYVLLVGVLNT